MKTKARQGRLENGQSESQQVTGDAGSSPAPAALDVLTTPIGFAEGVLRLKLYRWQDEVLSWYEDPRRRTKGVCLAPNGSGKDDRVIATLALWWVSVHARGKVVITSKDSRQLDEQTYPAIRKHAATFPCYEFFDRMVETPAGGKIILFTTNEPGRAEGWHKDDDIEGPLLIIVNEAKSVPEQIFEAFDRCTFNGLLYISSAGLMQGRLFDSATKHAASFRIRRVQLEECPHIPQERVEDILRTYGTNHPFTRSTLYSEFMAEDDESQFVVSLKAVDHALENPPRFVPGERVAFCDFAAGGDETVIACREGNRVEIAAAWRDRDTMATVGRCIMEFRKLGIRPEAIFGDETGLGKPMIDRLAEAGWEINRVNNGSAAVDSYRYCNRGAEIWHEGAAKVMRNEIILPKDGELKAQLTTRQSRIGSDGRLGVEKKADMKKRGLPSPDRADAVLGAIVCAPLRVLDRLDPRNRPFEAGEGWMSRAREIDENNLSDLKEALAGFDAGY